MRKIEAVIFDLEGTLLNCPRLSDEHLNTTINLIAKRKRTLPVETRGVLFSTRARLAERLGYEPTMVDTVAALGISKEDFYQCIESVDPHRYVQPDPLLTKALAKFKQECKIGLLTNVSRQTTARILHALGIDHNQFEAIVAGDEVSHIKPAKEPFLKLVGLLQAQLEKSVMVGDRIYIDLIPAKELGMMTVLLGRISCSPDFVDFIAPDILSVYNLLFINKHSTTNS